MPELMPWEKPLAKKLPEAAVCIGCGRHRRQIEDAHEDWQGVFRLLSEPHGLALCWRCSNSDEHDWWSEYLAARAALWKTKREEESHEVDHVSSG